MNKVIDNLSVKLFADGADLPTMMEMSRETFISGFTTNPTLMRKAGIKNYERFAHEVLEAIRDRPISFEVFSDDFEEMISNARVISSWGNNVNVKIPITNSKGISTREVVQELSREGIPLNITALMTLEQVIQVFEVIDENVETYISIFAGRIADTGRDPVPIMIDALKTIKSKRKTKLIWASPRELLNIFQANQIGCHVITATSDILKKLDLIGKDLTEYSLETVQMFRNDALSSGYTIQ